MALEIEKKWLFKDFPTQLKLKQSGFIYQSYLNVDGIECRIMYKKIRHPYRDDIYKMTFKTKGELVRQEVESYISKEFYEELLELISDLKPILKLYKIYKLSDGKELTVSNVDSKFFYGEIEFDNIEECKNYILPINEAQYIVVEEKDIPIYSMSNYWKNTRLN